MLEFAEEVFTKVICKKLHLILIIQGILQINLDIVL